jgi:hypothetical protein
MGDEIPGETSDSAASATLTFGYAGKQLVFLRSLFWFFGLLFFSLGLAGLAAPDVVAGAVLAAFCFGGGIGVLWFAEARFLKVSVEARPDALVVRNSLRTHLIAWPEIAGFGRARATALKDVRLNDRRRIKMQGLPPGWFGNQDPQRDGLQKLEAYRTRALAATAATPVGSESAQRTPG